MERVDSLIGKLLNFLQQFGIFMPVAACCYNSEHLASNAYIYHFLFFVILFFSVCCLQQMWWLWLNLHIFSSEISTNNENLNKFCACCRLFKTEMECGKIMKWNLDSSHWYMFHYQKRNYGIKYNFKQSCKKYRVIMFDAVLNLTFFFKKTYFRGFSMRWIWKYRGKTREIKMLNLQQTI